MPTEEKTDKKKSVLLRFTPKIYTTLLREASAESLRRGMQLTVPALCLEIVTAWVEGRKK